MHSERVQPARTRVLSRIELLNIKKKVVTTEKTMLFIAFRISKTLYIKILWCGLQKAVGVKKNSHKNVNFRCSKMYKFIFGCELLKLFYYLQKAETYSE